MWAYWCALSQVKSNSAMSQKSVLSWSPGPPCKAEAVNCPLFFSSEAKTCVSETAPYSSPTSFSGAVKLDATSEQWELFSCLPVRLLCRRVLRAGLPPGLLRRPGAEVDGPQQPGYGWDWARPAPFAAGPPGFPKPHRHRRAQASPHRLRSPQPKDRILSGKTLRLNSSLSVQSSKNCSVRLQPFQKLMQHTSLYGLEILCNKSQVVSNCRVELKKVPAHPW